MKTHFNPSPYTGINRDIGIIRAKKAEAEEEELLAADVDEDIDINQIPLEEEDEILEEEPVDEVTITGENEKAGEAEEIGEAKGGASLEDNSAALTRRLVSAKMQLQVSEIQGKASKNISDIMLAAAMSQDKDTIAQAKAIVRKLKKVVSRCQRKNRDLGKEESLRLQAQRAQKKKEIEKKREIERELKKRKLERKNREEGYLREKDNSEIDTPGNMVQNSGLSAAEKAQIEAQASMMAAMEIAAGGGAQTLGDAVSGIAGGDAAAGGSVGGAEMSGGAEVSGGSVDATV